MNPNQMAQQIKHELQQVTWDGGSVVFGDRQVFVTAGVLNDTQIPPRFPAAFVQIGTGAPDVDHPEIIEQSFEVIAAVSVHGDPMGEQAVIGGPVTSTSKSAGRGAAEVAERVRIAVEDLVGADGAHIIISDTSIEGPSLLANGKHLVLVGMTLTAWCTSRPFFAAPQQLRVNGSTWTWDGSLCSPRYDFIQYRLGYKAGGTPPATPADADGFAYTGTAETASHAPVGGRSYAIFADYGDRGTVEASSNVLGSSLASVSVRTYKTVQDTLQRPSDTTSYTALDTVAESTVAGGESYLTFEGCASKKGGSGAILGAGVAVDAYHPTDSLTLLLFRDVPQGALDNEALALIDSELPLVVHLQATGDGARSKVAVASEEQSYVFSDFESAAIQPIPYICQTSSQNLYGLLLSSAGAPVPRASFTVTLRLELD